MDETITVDEKLVARCGLYCGACGSYRKGKCPGCAGNEKATWCKVRSCCGENGYTTCADCAEFGDPNDCKKFNNFIAKVFAFIFRSDRAAGIAKVRAGSCAEYAKEMAEARRMTPKR